MKEASSGCGRMPPARIARWSSPAWQARSDGLASAAGVAKFVAGARAARFAKTRNGGRRSAAAEPIVAAAFPVAAEVLVHHVDGHDVLGVLEAELGRHPHLHREPVLARQDLVVELERHLGLRMQRGGHVDRGRIALGALEPDIWGAQVGADALEE